MGVRRVKAARTVVLVFVALTGAVLSGCSGQVGQPTTASRVGEPEPSAAASEPAAAPGEEPATTTGSDGYPTCDEVRSALGPAVDGLIELDGSENGVSTGADGPALTCSWFTPETDGSSIDVSQYGAIAVGVSRDPEYTEESMQPLGWNVEDARVEAAGAWALKVGGGYDPAAQLDMTGVQVVRDGVVVVLTSGGVVLQDVPQLAALTNEWAIGAGVAVLESTS
ncbi:hypothetical protein [Herbiconiux liukaitaii]|uniref:hypothetical protein n=1 Tax=Herbiconiux liukaitaii TaxID=3342799 RepID=UPI0035B9010D